jgi:uncharacterized protein (TIGR03000 family)
MLKRSRFTLVLLVAAASAWVLLPSNAWAQRHGGHAAPAAHAGGWAGHPGGYYGGYHHDGRSWGGFGAGVGLGYALGSGWGWGYPYSGYGSGYYPSYAYDWGYPSYDYGMYSGYGYPSDSFVTTPYPTSDYSTYGTMPGMASGYPVYGGDQSGMSYQSAYTPAASSPDAAMITVEVPDSNAQVWFDGDRTNQTGTVRTFESPRLDRGAEYSYKVRVRWEHDGKPVDQTRTVSFHAGDHKVVDFHQGMTDEGSRRGTFNDTDHRTRTDRTERGTTTERRDRSTTGRATDANERPATRTDRPRDKDNNRNRDNDRNRDNNNDKK